MDQQELESMFKDSEKRLQNADVPGTFLSISNQSLLPPLMTWISNYLSINTFLMQLTHPSWPKIPFH